MDISGWELAFGLVAGLLIGLALRRRAPRQDLTGAPAMPASPLAARTPQAGLPPLDPAQSAAIAEALARGEKIEAIKLLREATGRETERWNKAPHGMSRANEAVRLSDASYVRFLS